jgi:phospholipid/cholesterol/gamma-HCH transport system substrate-binding protein
MAKHANKTTIGLFVVGALILLVVVLVVLGSGRFFKKSHTYVAFFDGSVKGLSVGAPVMFRGVRIGKVEDFAVYYKRVKSEFKIPVLLTLYPEKVIGLGVELTEKEGATAWQEMLDAGLRAELQMQSLVTGQVGVQLDFHPEAPLNLHGLADFNLPRDVLEIPTVQSGFQRLTKTIEEIPLDKIVADLRSTLKGINDLVNSPETAKSLHYFKQTVKEARNLLRHIDEKVDPLFARVDQTLADAQVLIKTVDRQVDPLATSLTRTSDDARKLVNNVNSRIEPVHADLANTTKELRAALNAAEGALESIDDMVDENSEFRFQIDAFLNEITLMARSLRAFADYLERNPDALLRGKIKRTGQQ